MSYTVALAQTQGFTLGRPVQFTISPDGSRVVFLRTRGGRDPVRCLWVLDVDTGEERMVADPTALAEGDLAVPAAERAQRERRRDRSRGISSYATDQDVRHATYRTAARASVAHMRPRGVSRETPPSATSPSWPAPWRTSTMERFA